MAKNREFRSTPFERESFPLDNARTAFDWLVTGPAPMSLDGRLFPGLPDRRVPLDEVRAVLCDSRLPLSEVDQVWTYLVTRSRELGGSWTVACVGMALPALFAVAADLCTRYADDWRDIHGAVLVGFLSELATMDLTRPGVLWRLRCAALRAGHICVREALDRPPPSDEDFHSSEPTPPWGHPDFVLARAVAENAITEDEAELIGSTRLEDYTLEAASTDTGISISALQRARAHAEARLLEWLREQAAHEDSGDPEQHTVATEALNNAAITTAADHIRPTHRSRSVSTAPARFSVTVRYRAGKNPPESGVEGCGNTPAAPAHTTSLDPSTGTTGRPSGTTAEVRRCA
jgi:hypothetical protein